MNEIESAQGRAEVRPLTGIGTDEVHLHFTQVPQSGFDALFSRLAPLLTSEDIAAAERHVSEKHRILYAASHAFLRLTLARYTGEEPGSIAIVKTENDKPELRDRSLRFSLSHTAGLALVGISASADLGVDAERVDARHDLQALQRRVFTASERDVWNGEAEGFFDRWTLKESYAKARGGGLSLNLQRFGFPRVDEPELHCEPSFDDPRAWQFITFQPTPEHRAAAAVRVAAGAPLRWLREEGDILAVASNR